MSCRAAEIAQPANIAGVPSVKELLCVAIELVSTMAHGVLVVGDASRCVPWSVGVPQ